ncbi:MAG: CHAT domain-containing protein [Acidobacteriota bacterium]|nr:CHAT domain-containing protein [Acidobacteriota bacterium]
MSGGRPAARPPARGQILAALGGLRSGFVLTWWPLMGALAIVLACAPTPEPPAKAAPEAATVAPAAVEIRPEPAAAEVEDAPASWFYRLEVPAGGGILQVVAEQQGTDVVLQVLDPSGAALVEVDGPTGGFGPEKAVIRVADGGSYTARVRAPEARGAAAPGSVGFDLTAAWLEAVKLEQAPSFEAGLLATRAAVLAAEGDAESRRKAVDLYRRALQALPATGEERERGRLHHALSVLHRQGNDLEPAAAELAAAAELWQRAEDRHGEARALNELGLVTWQQGDGETPLSFYRRALEMRGELKDVPGQTQTLSNMGLVHHSRGQPREAREYYRRALDLLSEGNASPPKTNLAATLLNNLGGAAQDLGEPAEALGYFRQALEIHRRTDDPPAQVRALTNSGAALRQLGRYEEALTVYLEALELYRRQPATESPAQEARLLNNVGVVYLALADGERSRTYFQRALDGFRQGNEPRGEASALNNLAQALELEGERARALELYRQSLKLRRQLEDRRGEAIALDHLGGILLEEGDPDGAREMLERALELRREVADPVRQARTLRRLGEVHLSRDRNAAAREVLHQALELHRQGLDPQGEAETLGVLARVDRSEGRLEDARSRLEEGLELIESLSSRLAQPDLRTRFLAVRGDLYQDQVETLMALHRRDPHRGWHLRALEANERARDQVLLALLQTARSAASAGGSGAARQRDQLMESLSAKASLHTRHLSRGRQEAAAEVMHEIDELLTELETREAKLRRRDPAYERLTKPRSRSATELQALLDDETVLLEYALGKERSYLWAVGRRFVTSYELPPRGEIEQRARRLHELWSRLSPGDRGQQRALAAELSRQLLGPAAEHLAEGREGEAEERRLVIVADGALHYLPFAALPHPETADLEGRREPTPLLSHHQVVSLPSASVLAAQREGPVAASAHRGAKGVAVLADPIFSPRDPRVAELPGELGGEITGKLSPAAQALEEIPGLHRLAASRQEALALAALVPEPDLLLALGPRAQRSLLTSGAVAKHRIVHLATHGLLDDARPRLSGLMLSRIGEDGRPSDAFLGLADVYALHLDAELVVLSGCRTALGQQVQGAGLMGLTRGFLHAGARRVLASLWQVQDRATTELMEHFYRAHLVDHKPPAAALAEAQRSLAQDPRWRDPYHWAVFVLQGDWL